MGGCMTPGSRGVAGGMAGMADAIPEFRNFCGKAPPSGQFVFTGCHTNILLLATPCLGVSCGVYWIH